MEKSQYKERFKWAAIAATLASLLGGLLVFSITRSINQGLVIALALSIVSYFVIGYFLAKQFFGPRYLVGFGVSLLVGVASLAPLFHTVVQIIQGNISSLPDAIQYFFVQIADRKIWFELTTYEWTIIAMSFFLVASGILLSTSELRSKNSISNNIDQKSETILAKLLATLIVDVMRVLYISTDKQAFHVNSDRFSMFEEKAKNRLNDVRTQSTTFSTSISQESLNLSAEIARDCAWVLNQVHNKSDVTFDMLLCFMTMKRSTENTYNFCSRAMTNDFEKAIELVEGVMTHNKKKSSNKLSYRLGIQTSVLDAIGNGEIKTIAHDTSQDVALYYLVIDHAILSEHISS